MPTLAFEFIAGRYHATPWGHLANEGLVEWPPSPWRLIRALMAAGFATRGWTTLPDDARRLVSALTSKDPEFELPPACASHVRHWMPAGDGRTRVLDPFVAVSPKTPLLVHYPCELDESLTRLLRDLVASTTYLGRAESWVFGHLLDGRPEDKTLRSCRAVTSLPPGFEGVRLLAPMTADAYTEWRIANTTTRSGKRRGHSKQDALPEDIAECVLADTGRLQKGGWSDPPGTQWVLYARPADALNAVLLRRAIHSRSAEITDTMLLAITPTPSSQTDERRGARPLMTRALPQAELIHQSAVAALGDEAPECEVLTGRARDGARLRGHGHAHYLPLDLDSDGRLDHVLVYAPRGLDAQAQRALARVRRTWTKRQVGDVAVRVVGRGTLAELTDQLRVVSRRSVRVVGEGRVWMSVTPFVPPRHLKRTRHTLEDQVCAELASRGKPAPSSVELLPPRALAQRRFFSYVTTRRDGKPQPPAPISFGLRITFDTPVYGPIAIGYASHFGLGLFAIEE